ncbi:MAG: phage terminase large subunit family protein [Dehalococcoidia bacterium]
MGNLADGLLEMGLACVQAQLEALAAGMDPDESLTVDAWAERHMVIPKSAGAAEPGPYRVERTPYARGVMRALSSDDPCRQVVVVGASQMLKTQVALNWIGASIHQAPANILVLLPSLGLAKRASSRISKAIDAVPVLTERVAKPRSRDSSNTIDTKEFDGGTMYITTAGSTANLSEISARYLYGDEIDRWESDVGSEGDPVELAIKRLTTFSHSSKAYFTSSPTEEGGSRIESLYEKSTRRRYFVPCPHCQTMHTLEWDNVRWAEDLSRAWMVCQACGCEVDESDKEAMLAAGEWRAGAVGDGRTEGFQISALYMPLGWASWLDLARERVVAEELLKSGDDSELKVFENTRLARSYKRSGEKLDHERIKERAEAYELMKVPAGGLLLTMAVDVQADRLEYQVVAWGRGEESWLVDFDRIYGDPGQELVWTRLDEVRARTITHASGAQLRVDACAIDTGGHHTHQVYAYCRTREHQRVFAIKGDRDVKTPIKGRARMFDVNLRGRVLKHGVRLWFVGVHVAKDLLAGRFKLAQPGPGYVHLPKILPDDYFEQLTAEQRVRQRTAHGDVWRWVKPSSSTRNEAWDLWVYCLWAAHVLDLPKYRAAQWDRLEQFVAPRQGDLLTAPTEPAPAPPPDQPAPKPAAKRAPSSYGSDDWNARL